MKRYSLEMAPDGYGGTNPAMIQNKLGHFVTYKEAKKERKIVTKLLSLLNPGMEPSRDNYTITECQNGTFDKHYAAWQVKKDLLYPASCEIAGRTE
jgi:hypothetical protein